MSMLKSLRHSPLVRLLLIGSLILLLQIPTCMVRGVHAERSQARDAAAQEIAGRWGGRQELLGPFVVVPYRYKDSKGEWQGPADRVVTPALLSVDSAVAVEVRERGIFGLPVFKNEVMLRGRFDLAAASAGVNPEDTQLLWDRARLVLALADLRSVDSTPALRWAGNALDLRPGGGFAGLASLHAPLPHLKPDGTAEFQLQLRQRGSGGLYFAPVGRTTKVRARSAWPHPGFQGAWLPQVREVSASGFSADWEVPEVARDLPSSWSAHTVTADALRATLFGVELLQPVDPYRMTERSLKYAVLFVGLTFLAMWLFEQRSGRPVHPLQYLLVGAALCIFYLLELSLAEWLGFGAAYAIASVAVSVQVALYGRAALRSGRAALGLFAATGTLYGLLYLLLNEEDYALLIGSAGLFVVLSAVMFLTRHIEWGRNSGEALPA